VKIKANKAISDANILLAEAEDKLKEGKKSESEKLFRKSLKKIREAILWKPENNDYRKFIHSIGLKIHDLFGCIIEPHQGRYMIICPVMLSHIKGGFSIGGFGTTICSICGENILNCEHVKGETYNGIIAKRHHGICNVCGKEKCEHQDGNTYDNVTVFGLITNMTIDHISLVENPANPLCAIEMIGLPKSDILESLSENERKTFIYGETVINCHHCKVCSE